MKSSSLRKRFLGEKLWKWNSWERKLGTNTWEAETESMNLGREFWERN